MIGILHAFCEFEHHDHSKLLHMNVDHLQVDSLIPVFASQEVSSAKEFYNQITFQKEKNTTINTIYEVFIKEFKNLC